MLKDIITLPDERLEYIGHETTDTGIRIHIEPRNTEANCPYCGVISDKVHSRYKRTLQDLPIQGKKVKLLLDRRKYFCSNPECSRKTFAEQFEFFKPKSVRTRRLQEEILRVSLTQSSISASKYLRNSIVDVGKSTICDMLKKEREKG